MWGDGTPTAEMPAGLSGVTAIAAGLGSQNVLALKDDGTVVGWGSNSYGRIDIPADLSGVVAISAGSTYALALKNDGSVVGWGSNSSGMLAPQTGMDVGNAWATTAYSGRFRPAFRFDCDRHSGENPTAVPEHSDRLKKVVAR